MNHHHDRRHDNPRDDLGREPDGTALADCARQAEDALHRLAHHRHLDAARNEGAHITATPHQRPVALTFDPVRRLRPEDR